MSPTPTMSFVLIACSLAGALAAPTVNPPKFTLSFIASFNSTGVKNVVAADQARAKHLIEIGNLTANANGAQIKAKRADTSITATNTNVVYTTNVGIGNPPTNYNLLIDTGSSNTWVGASQPYVQTSSSKDTGESVSVNYGSGFMTGEEFIDTVTINPTLLISEQSIGVANASEGIAPFDGILGIGPVDLTKGTTSGGEQVPTVADNLLAQGIISNEVIGIFFAPSSTSSGSDGELTFGDVDSSKFTGSITFTSVTTTQPASSFWGINQSINYGTNAILSTNAGIVDTGTTLILIATDAFNAYKAATGATTDPATGLLTITPSQFGNLQDLNFVVEGTTFALSPNGQIWPRSQNSAIGGSAGNIYLVVNDIGTPSGSGLDFINGFTFLERLYSVFDTTNNQVGFATTAFTEATSN